MAANEYRLDPYRNSDYLGIGAGAAKLYNRWQTGKVNKQPFMQLNMPPARQPTPEEVAARNQKALMDQAYAASPGETQARGSIQSAGVDAYRAPLLAEYDTKRQPIIDQAVAGATAQRDARQSAMDTAVQSAVQNRAIAQNQWAPTQPQQQTGFNPMDGLGFNHMMARNKRAGTMLDYPKALQNEDATTVADRQARQSRGQPEPVAQQPSDIIYDYDQTAPIDPKAQFDPYADRAAKLPRHTARMRGLDATLEEIPTVRADLDSQAQARPEHPTYPNASYQHRTDMSPQEAQYVAWVQQQRRVAGEEFQGRYAAQQEAARVEDFQTNVLPHARTFEAAGGLTPAQQAFHAKGIAAIREHTPASGPYQSEAQQRASGKPKTAREREIVLKQKGDAATRQTAFDNTIKGIDAQLTADMTKLDKQEQTKLAVGDQAGVLAVQAEKEKARKAYAHNTAGILMEQAKAEIDPDMKDALFSRARDALVSVAPNAAATPPPAVGAPVVAPPQGGPAAATAPLQGDLNSDGKIDPAEEEFNRNAALIKANPDMPEADKLRFANRQKELRDQLGI